MHTIAPLLLLTLWDQPLAASGTPWPGSRTTPAVALSATPIRDAISRDARALASLGRTRRGGPNALQSNKSNRSWIERHPVCFGATVGFLSGFVVGFLAGDDGVFDDFSAAGNGLILGGIGAGAGAILGWSGGRN